MTISQDDICEILTAIDAGNPIPEEVAQRIQPTLEAAVVGTTIKVVENEETR